MLLDLCGFEEMFKVAAAMATHKQYTRTLFSTPSTKAHEAYPMWSGDKFNKRRPKDKRVRIDITHDTLAPGVLGPDGIWRQIVNIHDAIAKGLDLVDLDELRLETVSMNLRCCSIASSSTTTPPCSL
jgi:hypothetical protein